MRQLLQLETGHAHPRLAGFFLAKKEHEPLRIRNNNGHM